MQTGKLVISNSNSNVSLTINGAPKAVFTLLNPNTSNKANYTYAFENGTPTAISIDGVTWSTGRLTLGEDEDSAGGYSYAESYIYLSSAGVLSTYIAENDDYGDEASSGDATATARFSGTIYFKSNNEVVSDVVDLVGATATCHYEYEVPEPPCFTSDTPVVTKAGVKLAEDINYNDELLCWDFDNGEFTYAKPLWIDTIYTYHGYNETTWSDGSVFKATGTAFAHRAYNVEQGKFVYTKDFNIGEHTIDANGNQISLVSSRNVEEDVEACNIITDYHMNLVAGNLLTSCRLSNLYDIDKTTMTYIDDGREIIPFELFDIPKEWYDGLRIGEQPLDINPDGSIYIGDDTVEDYVKRLMRSMRPKN